MDIKKGQFTCPNSQETVKDLDDSDWSRLSCQLYTAKKVLIREMPNCEIDKNTLDEGQTYLVKITEDPVDKQTQLSTAAQKQPKVHFVRVIT